MPLLAIRPSYSIPALTKYLTHISLPSPHRTTLLQNISRRGWSTSNEALTFLQHLQKYQQVKIPFANLYLHYSKHHVGTLDAGKLYEYIVNSSGIAREGECDKGILNVVGEENGEQGERVERWKGRGPSGGRGGSCTLNNGFFGAVMRGLNMKVKSTGARVSKAANGRLNGKFDGWGHLINIVSFEGRRFLVDVAFGGNGPTGPLELKDGNEVPWGITDDRMRVVWKTIDEFEDREEKIWVLQHKKQGEAWMDIYCFWENEFLPADIEVMNFKSTKDLRGSFFNYMVICVRTEMEGEDVVGTMMLVDGKVKRRIHGKNELLVDCSNEVERWEALEKYFGIVLGDQERQGIRGLGTELKSKFRE